MIKESTHPWLRKLPRKIYPHSKVEYHNWGKKSTMLKTRFRILRFCVFILVCFVSFNHFTSRKAIKPLKCMEVTEC